MPVNNELLRPDTDSEFEQMCHALYKRMWRDVSCARVGRSGQEQFGVDILGHDGVRTVGIQCKHYNAKKFTLATILGDVQKADEAHLQIGHLLFATTAPSSSTLVVEIRKISEQRRAKGQFTVSVDFWDEICGQLRIYQEVGRSYIRNFPGAPTLDIRDTLAAHVAQYSQDRETTIQVNTDLRALTGTMERLLREVAPVDRSGNEADLVVARTLDLARDKNKAGQHREARAILEALAQPGKFQDKYSTFRWHTNLAICQVAEGKEHEGARSFLHAFQFAPEDEKALANRIRAFLVLNRHPEALSACDEALVRHPTSGPLWSLKILSRFFTDQPESIDEIPQDVAEHADVLYALWHVRHKQGRHSEALALIRKCVEKEPSSLEGKRAYLATALNRTAS